MAWRAHVHQPASSARVREARRAETLHVVEVADRRAPSVVRRRLRGWLDEISWPPEARDDLVLAVSEAVSNSVEHAYAAGQIGTTDVDVIRAEDPDGTERVIVKVCDDGRWREPEFDPENRGRGLPIMRAVTDALRLARTRSGTCLEMVSRPIHRKRR